MIESRKGVDNLEKILKVKDIDLIFLGPYDLSASMAAGNKLPTAVPDVVTTNEISPDAVEIPRE